MKHLIVFMLWVAFGFVITGGLNVFFPRTPINIITYQYGNDSSYVFLQTQNNDGSFKDSLIEIKYDK